MAYGYGGVRSVRRVWRLVRWAAQLSFQDFMVYHGPCTMHTRTLAHASIAFLYVFLCNARSKGYGFICLLTFSCSCAGYWLEL